MLRFPRLVGVSATALVIVALLVGIRLRVGAATEGEELSAAEIVQEVAPGAAAALGGDIAIPVTGAEAIRGTLVISVNASGQAEAWRRTVITPQVAGRISALPVRENARVSAEQALVVIDPVEHELRVQEAQVQLRSAEAAYRELTLFDDRIPDAEARAERERFARARSGLEAAELALRRAELELERTRVTAPIAGRVASLKVVPGEWVGPSTELMTLVDIDPIRVEVQVLEGEVGYLAPGRGARVSFAAFPGETFAGRIEGINPVVESGTRTARVTVLVPNPDGRILPGMYARVALEAREFSDRVMVPRAAILERDRRKMLFVYDPDDRGGRAKWRYVTTGLENESYVEILANVATDSVRAGEVVLTDGHYTLIHDARVTVAEHPGS
jgi:membrane fusion protein, multidrug efflux system